MNIENREISQKLVDIIDFLKQSISKLSVYDLNYYSMSELYYNIAKKINELIEAYHEFGVSISEEVIKQNECLQYLLNEGLNTEVVKKINQMVADGIMDTIINHNVFSELNSQIKEKANIVDLAIERARIDNFTRLSEGSTTGDAELIDGRIGSDNVTYSNIGEAIRNQVDCLRVNDFKRVILPNIVEGQYVHYSNGIVADEPTYCYGTLHINKTGTAKIKFLDLATESETNFNHLVFFNGDTYISGLSDLNAIGEITIPKGTTKICYSYPVSYRGRVAIEFGNPTILDEFFPKDYFIMKEAINNINYSIMFDNIVEGQYVHYSNGVIGDEPTYCYGTLHINRTGNARIKFLDLATSKETNYNHIVFFNGDTYISGLNDLNAIGEIEIPEGTTKICYSYPISYKGRVVIEFGNMSEYKTEDKTVEQIIVSKDGTTGYSSIQSALDHVHEDLSKEYEIYIKEGVYEEGMFELHGNVSLIGENRETTIIKTNGNNYGISDINARHCIMNSTDTGNVRIENLQFDSIDVKYCIHIDQPCSDTKIKIKDCKFKNNHPCIGMGLHDNQFVEIENCVCEFKINDDYNINDYWWNFGIYLHDWYTSTKPCGLIMKNIKCINCKILDLDTHVNNLYDKVLVENCTSNLWNIISVRGADNITMS